MPLMKRERDLSCQRSTQFITQTCKAVPYQGEISCTVVAFKTLSQERQVSVIYITRLPKSMLFWNHTDLSLWGMSTSCKRNNIYVYVHAVWYFMLHCCRLILVGFFFTHISRKTLTIYESNPRRINWINSQRLFIIVWYFWSLWKFRAYL